MQVHGKAYQSIWYKPDNMSVGIIDQTRLPFEFVCIDIRSLEEMVYAIGSMQVRGAPLIGVAGAFGLALAAMDDPSTSSLMRAAATLIGTRPTAVNLAWAVNLVLQKLLNVPESSRCERAFEYANSIREEELKTAQQIGQHGLKIIKGLARKKNGLIQILTHCNAGWLATVDWGTALAPIYAADAAGIKIHVWVDETRPRNQGASLTSFELSAQGIDHTVIVDNAGGHLMQQGEVDMVIVGADRCTRTGDVCNKIGTYLKALAAKDNGIPFFVALPCSTIDWEISNGRLEIPIEERSGDEVRELRGLSREGVLSSILLVPSPATPVANPGFDVTPHRLISGLITEHGLYRPSELDGLKDYLTAQAIYPEGANRLHSEVSEF